VRKIAQNRPTKLTLSSTLLQSSHNNYEKRDILGKNINSVSSQPNIEVLAKKMKKMITLQSGHQTKYSINRKLSSTTLTFCNLYISQEKTV